MSLPLAVLLLLVVGCGDKDDSGAPDTDEPPVECAMLWATCSEEQYNTLTCDESCGWVVFCARSIDGPERTKTYYWITVGAPCECLTEDGEIDERLCPENDCY